MFLLSYKRDLNKSKQKTFLNRFILLSSLLFWLVAGLLVTSPSALAQNASFSIEAEQVIDEKVLPDEELVKMSAAISDTSEASTIIISWQYRLLYNLESADATTCENTHTTDNDIDHPLYHLYSTSWKSIEQTQQFESQSGQIFDYNNDQLQRQVSLYPPQKHYGKWICLRADNGSTAAYIALNLLSSAETPPANTGSGGPIIDEPEQLAQADTNVLESLNSENNVTTTPDTGILNSENIFVRSLSYIFFAGLIIGMVHIFLIGKRKKT